MSHVYWGSWFTPFLITENFWNCLPWIIFCGRNTIPVYNEPFKECRLACWSSFFTDKYIKFEKHLLTVMLSGKPQLWQIKILVLAPCSFWNNKIHIRMEKRAIDVRLKSLFLPPMTALLSCLLVLADKIRPYSLPRYTKNYMGPLQTKSVTKNTKNK